MLSIWTSFQNYRLLRVKKEGYQDSKFCTAFLALTLYSIDTRFDTSTTDSFENIMGKEKIACDEQFLLFQQCFYSIR